MLDDRVTNILHKAGCLLADVIRKELNRQGLPDTLHVHVERGRVTVGSYDGLLRDRELGLPGLPPSSLFEGVARAAFPAILAEVKAGLRDAAE